MIKNEKQYKITRAKIRDFAKSISVLEEKLKEHPGELLELEYDARRGQMLDLQKEVKEYEDLKSSNTPKLEFTSIEDLPQVLIKCRIALALSHKDLAEKAGLHEQQIQRYEQTDYESASFARIKEIFKVLEKEKKLLPV